MKKVYLLAISCALFMSSFSFADVPLDPSGIFADYDISYSYAVYRPALGGDDEPVPANTRVGCSPSPNGNVDKNEDYTLSTRSWKTVTWFGGRLVPRLAQVPIHMKV